MVCAKYIVVTIFKIVFMYLALCCCTDSFFRSFLGISADIRSSEEYSLTLFSATATGFRAILEKYERNTALKWKRQIMDGKLRFGNWAELL